MHFWIRTCDYSSGWLSDNLYSTQSQDNFFQLSNIINSTLHG